jgi:hypothetical protein
VKGAGSPLVYVVESKEPDGPEEGVGPGDPGGFGPGGPLASGPNEGQSGSSSTTGSVDDLCGSLNVIAS